MSQALVTNHPELIKAALDAGDVDALMALNRARYGGWTMLEGDGADADADASKDADADADKSGDTDADKDADADADADKDAEKDPRVTKANKEAARYRTELRAAQAEQTKLSEQFAKLKAAFLGEDDKSEADPAKVTAEAEKLRETNAALTAALLVHDLAPELQANATALLDSQTFAKTLAGLDPAAEDYTDKVTEAIKASVAKNAAHRAGQGSSRGGSELTAEQREKANAKPKSLSEAIAKRMGV
jgi:hypothetical protein